VNLNGPHTNSRAFATVVDQVPREDEMRFYDALPAAIRECIASAAIPILAAGTARRALRLLDQGHDPQAVMRDAVQAIRNAEARELYSYSTPHNQAGVTVQRPEYGVVLPRRRRR
jgi:7-keto-8-aminopelargonate synthetase-like enzyme